MSNWCEEFTHWGFIYGLINIFFSNFNFFIKLNSECLVKIWHNWARWWLSFSKETGHYLNQWWLSKKPTTPHGMPSELSETNINDYVSTLLKYVIVSFHLMKPRLYLLWIHFCTVFFYVCNSHVWRDFFSKCKVIKFCVALSVFWGF